MVIYNIFIGTESLLKIIDYDLRIIQNDGSKLHTAFES
mgnify:FL=1